MQVEAEEPGDKLHATPTVKVGSSFKMGYRAPMSVALGFSSSSRHYSGAKLVSRLGS